MRFTARGSGLAINGINQVDRPSATVINPHPATESITRILCFSGTGQGIVQKGSFRLGRRELKRLIASCVKLTVGEIYSRHIENAQISATLMSCLAWSIRITDVTETTFQDNRLDLIKPMACSEHFSHMRTTKSWKLWPVRIVDPPRQFLTHQRLTTPTREMTNTEKHRY
jgi:hypothetical protein